MLSALTHLDVSKNQLTKWPNQLDQLQQLATLNVRDAAFQNKLERDAVDAAATRPHVPRRSRTTS